MTTQTTAADKRPDTPHGARSEGADSASWTSS